jgi:hypothetical protein
MQWKNVFEKVYEPGVRLSLDMQPMNLVFMFCDLILKGMEVMIQLCRYDILGVKPRVSNLERRAVDLTVYLTGGCSSR